MNWCSCSLLQSVRARAVYTGVRKHGTRVQPSLLPSRFLIIHEPPRVARCYFDDLHAPVVIVECRGDMFRVVIEPCARLIGVRPRMNLRVGHGFVGYACWF